MPAVGRLWPSLGKFSATFSNESFAQLLVSRGLVRSFAMDQASAEETGRGRVEESESFISKIVCLVFISLSVLDTAMWRKYSRNKYEIKTSIASESGR